MNGFLQWIKHFRKECCISKKDIEAIKYFKKEGGIFTVATGRTVNRTYFLNEFITLDLPAIFANGAMIATLSDKKQLWVEKTDKCIKEIILDFYNKNPDICIVISSDNKDYIYNIDKLKNFIYTLDGFNVTFGKISDITTPFIKTAIVSQNPLLDILNEEYKEYLDRIYFTKSGANFYEIVSKNVSKGNALKKLKTLTNISFKKIIAIGDNYNDIELIENADIGVAVENNCKALINKADFTVDKNDVIYKLINKLV